MVFDSGALNLLTEGGVSDFNPPPDGNTGVELTKSTDAFGTTLLPNAGVDYLSGTFPDGTRLEDVFAILDNDGWSRMERGFYGYKYAFVRGACKVAYGGNEGMGVFFEASGSGCRELEAMGVASDWSAFLKKLLHANFRASRCDLAVDDVGNIINLEVVKSSIGGGRVLSRWRKSSVYQSLDLSNGQSKGQTVYFGSRLSDKSARFYDKGAELGLEESFVRVEVELRREQAQAGVSLIAEGYPFGLLLRGVLSAVLSFRVDDGTPNKYRWPVADWWALFLASCELVRLSLPQKVMTFHKVYAWMAGQVAPLMAMLVAAAGGDVGVIDELVAFGRKRWGKKHKDFLDKWSTRDMEEVGGLAKYKYGKWGQKSLFDNL